MSRRKENHKCVKVWLVAVAGTELEHPIEAKIVLTRYPCPYCSSKSRSQYRWDSREVGDAHEIGQVRTSYRRCCLDCGTEEGF